MQFVTFSHHLKGGNSILQQERSFEIDSKLSQTNRNSTIAIRNDYLHKFFKLKIVKMIHRQCGGWKITIHNHKDVMLNLLAMSLIKVFKANVTRSQRDGKGNSKMK